jgi:dihydrofolate reductase
MNLHEPALRRRQVPFRITFSINSSNNPSRQRDFPQQIAAVSEALSSDEVAVVVQSVTMGELSLEEQLQIVKESSIFISVIGGAASTATFLERDSCLILFFDDVDDFVKGSGDPLMPNMMDWDVWNHAASYLRVHWLPIKTMDDKLDLEILVKLIMLEISVLSRSLAEY